MPETPLRSVVLLALRLGFTAFGGPAAHIAMLRDEVVGRRAWTTEQRFLDLIGITNLIPGPNSTEMVMHIGQERAGRKGLVGAGTAFILPAASITLVFAWLYVRYGTTPEGEWLLRGIKPVVLAVVVQAIWNLGKTAFKSTLLAAVGTAVFGLYLLGVNEILLLFGGALVAFLLQREGLGSAEELFDLLYIDPGINPFVLTARIRQAMFAVQIYVVRCLMGFERAT